jgi:site-specific recombinase XerD
MSALIKEDPADRFWSRLSCQERHQIMSQDRQGESSGSGPNLISTPLEPAIERYLKIKEGQNLQPLTLRQIRWKLGMLQKAFGGSKCHEITTTMMEDWFRVKKWKRSTIDGVMAKIGPFFSWCIRESYCIYNPLKYIILPKEDDDQPCIFSPGQISNLMVAAASQDPGMVPYLALGTSPESAPRS